MITASVECVQLVTTRIYLMEHALKYLDFVEHALKYPDFLEHALKYPDFIKYMLKYHLLDNEVAIPLFCSSVLDAHSFSLTVLLLFD